MLANKPLGYMVQTLINSLIIFYAKGCYNSSGINLYVFLSVCLKTLKLLADFDKKLKEMLTMTHITDDYTLMVVRMVVRFL